MITFKRALAVVTIIAVFGGGSLGAGLGLGFALGRQYINHTPAVQYQPVSEENEERVTFAFSDQYAETLPLEVRVSDITGVVQTVSGSVVSINIEVPSANHFFRNVYNPGSGSGIIFAEDENFIYIATNNHVVYRAARIGISLDDEYEVDAVLIGGDWYADLAVLSVPRASLENKEYHVAIFGDSDMMLVGDEVVAIGNPMGGGQTATRGIVSAINRQITVDGRTLNVLQTDAAINPGNSGGALANIRGEIIGINTAKAIAFHIEGMGYAIPSNEAREILDYLLEQGTTPRPFLGVDIALINEQIRRMYALPSVGLIVTGVHPDTPAERAGIKEFDLIVGFNETPVTTREELAEALVRAGIGETVTLQIYRAGNNGLEPLDVSITIGDANLR